MIKFQPDTRFNFEKGNANYQVHGQIVDEPFIINICRMASSHAMVQVFMSDGLPSTEAISRLALHHVGLDPDQYQWRDEHRKRVWDLTFLGEQS